MTSTGKIVSSSRSAALRELRDYAALLSMLFTKDQPQAVTIIVDHYHFLVRWVARGLFLVLCGPRVRRGGRKFRMIVEEGEEVECFGDEKEWERGCKMLKMQRRKVDLLADAIGNAMPRNAVTALAKLDGSG